MRRVATGILATLSLALVGCDASESVKVALALSPKDNYARGLRALKKNELLEAEKYFNYAKARGHGEWSTLAEIRLADVYFARERYGEAIDAYQLFARAHSGHPETDHAVYRAALSYYRQMPDDWFILPPAYERDLRPTIDARKAYDYYLNRFPNGRYSAAARTEALYIRSRLADHEIYVADFYEKRGKWLATIGRLEFARTEFAGLGRDEEILFRLGRAYINADQFGKGVDALKSLVARYPGGKYRVQAERLLARVGAKPAP